MTSRQKLFFNAICLVFTINLSNLNAKAQDDWQTGYVVTNAGDTLEGMVRDRKSGAFGKLYGKVVLKQTGKGKKSFKPKKIQCYMWGRSKYVTLRTQSSSRGFKTDIRVSPDGEPGFYRVVSEGPLSLYHLEYSDQDNSAIDFIPYFKREGNPSLVRATQGVFGLKKKLLSNFFADKPELVNQINDGRLKTPEEVVKAFQLLRKP